MKIRPIGDRIVIKVIEDTAQTEGGIFIPDSAKEKPQKGEVVAVGEGKTLDSGEKAPVSVKVGETIIYEKYAGRDIKIDGETLKILSTSDVLGVLEAWADVESAYNRQRLKIRVITLFVKEKGYG